MRSDCCGYDLRALRTLLREPGVTSERSRRSLNREKDETYMLKLGKANLEKNVEEGESLCRYRPLDEGEWLTTEEEFGRPVPDWPFRAPYGNGYSATSKSSWMYSRERPSPGLKGQEPPVPESKDLLRKNPGQKWGAVSGRQGFLGAPGMKPIRMRCQWEVLPHCPANAGSAHLDLEGLQNPVKSSPLLRLLLLGIQEATDLSRLTQLDLDQIKGGWTPLDGLRSPVSSDHPLSLSVATCLAPAFLRAMNALPRFPALRLFRVEAVTRSISPRAIQERFLFAINGFPDVPISRKTRRSEAARLPLQGRNSRRDCALVRRKSRNEKCLVCSNEWRENLFLKRSIPDRTIRQRGIAYGVRLSAVDVPLEERIGEGKKHRFHKHNRTKKREKKEAERRARGGRGTARLGDAMNGWGIRTIPPSELLFLNKRHVRTGGLCDGS
ncbi:hypothetical protein B0H14DRAFT_2650622 [Mycena olivaceomarginata]|nr:hypothetical protein B0H14DRAFT_2650622 [Mycena olivaceomarginata]